MYKRIAKLLENEGAAQSASAQQSTTKEIEKVAKARKRRTKMDANIARMAGIEPSQSGRSRPDTSLGS